MTKVLIIGFGNPWRGDDDVGCDVARMLAALYDDDPEVRVISAHQLTPEMAEAVSASEFVLFLDAATGTHAGEIKHSTVAPRPGSMSFAHSLDPRLLLAAADELYGSVPPAELLTIVGACFEVGDCLSTAVIRQLPELFERAHEIVESHRHPAVRELVQ